MNKKKLGCVPTRKGCPACKGHPFRVAHVVSLRAVAKGNPLGRGLAQKTSRGETWAKGRGEVGCAELLFSTNGFLRGVGGAGGKLPIWVVSRCSDYGIIKA